MGKQCSQCGVKKLLSEFYKDKRARDGLYSNCRKCHDNFHVQWRKENPEFDSQWREKNRNKLRAYYREYQREHPRKYNSERREYFRKYAAKRRRIDMKFRLNENISTAIRHALKGRKECAKWEDLVGYKIKDLMKSLETRFEDWMSWENYGAWEIDHIKPKSLFAYKTPQDIEFKKCWALDNLQPLEKSANRKKHNKYLIQQNDYGKQYRQRII